MKINPKNIDGLLVSTQEYEVVRAKLLKEKTSIQGSLAKGEKHFEEIDQLLVGTFDMAVRANRTLASGNAPKIKNLLHAMGANLTIGRDKQIDITPRYPFELIDKAKREKGAFEPNNSLNFEKSFFGGSLPNDVRTFYSTIPLQELNFYNQSFRILTASPTS